MNRNKGSSAFYSGATRYGGSSAIAKRREAARKAFFNVKEAPTSSRTSGNPAPSTLNGPTMVHSYTINTDDIIRREPAVPQLTTSAKRILNWIEQNSTSPYETAQLSKRRKVQKHRFNPISYRAPTSRIHESTNQDLDPPAPSPPPLPPKIPVLQPIERHKEPSPIKPSLPPPPPPPREPSPVQIPPIEPPKSFRFKSPEFCGHATSITLAMKPRKLAPGIEHVEHKVEPPSIVIPKAPVSRRPELTNQKLDPPAPSPPPPKIPVLQPIERPKEPSPIKLFLPPPPPPPIEPSPVTIPPKPNQQPPIEPPKSFRFKSPEFCGHATSITLAMKPRKLAPGIEHVEHKVEPPSISIPLSSNSTPPTEVIIAETNAVTTVSAKATTSTTTITTTATTTIPTVVPSTLTTQKFVPFIDDEMDIDPSPNIESSQSTTAPTKPLFGSAPNASSGPAAPIAPFATSLMTSTVAPTVTEVSSNAPMPFFSSPFVSSSPFPGFTASNFPSATSGAPPSSIPTLTAPTLPNGSNPFQPPPSSSRGRKILRPTRRLHR